MMRKVKLVVIATDLLPTGGYLGVAAPVRPPHAPQFTITVQDATPEDSGQSAVGLVASGLDLYGSADFRKRERKTLVDEALRRVRDFLYAAIDEDANPA